jgi:hypothetical protein
MMLFVILLLQIPARPNTMTMKQKVEQLNIWGLIALLPGVVCLCLALQWGGFTYEVCFEHCRSFQGVFSAFPFRADFI